MSTQTAILSAAPEAGTDALRFNIYHSIHKAMRLMMCDALSRTGSVDPDDDAQVRTTLERVHALLELCAKHIAHEDAFLHPALEAARLGSSAPARGEHRHHEESIADLRDLAGLVGDTQGTARHTALDRLYKALAVFVGENFLHMHEEETGHNAVLWGSYSDAQLHEVHDRLVASIPPQEMMETLAWFLPALHATERAQMLLGMRAGMPAPAFEAVLGLARQCLSAPEFAKLQYALG
jgi:hypothetical protein